MTSHVSFSPAKWLLVIAVGVPALLLRHWIFVGDTDVSYDARSELHLATEAWETGDIDEALKHAENSVQADGSLRESHLLLGACQVRLGSQETPDTRLLRKGLAQLEFAEHDAVEWDRESQLLLAVARTMALYNLREFDKAVGSASRMMKLVDADAGGNNEQLVARRLAGECYLASGWLKRGVSLLVELYNVDRQQHDALNSAAWELAVSPQSKGVDARTAVRHAQTVCEATDWKNSDYLDTLAIAYARVGDFDQAVRYVKLAIKRAASEQESDEYRTRLRLFEKRQPFVRKGDEYVVFVWPSTD